MEENRNKEENEEPQKDGVAIRKATIGLGTVTVVGACGVKVMDEVKSLEMDLVKTTNKAGKPTGQGNMFENVLVREFPGARKVNNPGSPTNPLLREKNGVDIILADGTKVQAKCCRTAEATFQSLMKDGKYRYGEQIPCVPNGQGKRVSQLLHDVGVDIPVLESRCTYGRARKLCKPNWISLKFDATNPKILGLAGIAGGAVACGAYVYLHLNKPHKPWWKKTLKAIGMGALTFGSMELMTVGYCQFKRICF